MSSLTILFFNVIRSKPFMHVPHIRSPQHNKECDSIKNKQTIAVHNRWLNTQQLQQNRLFLQMTYRPMRYRKAQLSGRTTGCCAQTMPLPIYHIITSTPQTSARTNTMRNIESRRMQWTTAQDLAGPLSCLSKTKRRQSTTPTAVCCDWGRHNAKHLPTHLTRRNRLG